MNEPFKIPVRKVGIMIPAIIREVDAPKVLAASERVWISDASNAADKER